MASGPFSPGGGTHHPCGPQTGNPHAPAVGREDSGLPSALRPRAVSGAPTRPKMPSPGVTLPGPFVTPPSPVLPVATALAAYLRGSRGVRARRSVRVRSRTGRLRRSFYPPFIASPFLLEVNLVPSHCGSRALSGLGGYSFASDPQGRPRKRGSPRLGFPVSAPSGQQKNAEDQKMRSGSHRFFQREYREATSLPQPPYQA